MTDGRIVLCNGEIFNSDILIRKLGLVVPAGSSDCAVIPALLERGLPLTEVARQLDGDFAIVILDLKAGTGTVARTGITGALIGNTAEVVLDSLESDVLVLKTAEVVAHLNELAQG
jgi:hypothetical protein